MEYRYVCVDKTTFDQVVAEYPEWKKEVTRNGVVAYTAPGRTDARAVRVPVTKGFVYHVHRNSMPLESPLGMGFDEEE